ncbi:MAG: patatin-like phospholipase family protein [Phycisphaeraceae bacterium]|nr:patatin-like phospholipase family protein [Phycisphaeraceae bacterium]
MARIGAVILIVFAAGCSMHDDRSWIHPHREGLSFEAPDIDLTFYRSPQQRIGQDPDLSVAVAISGGGERAANFAAGIFVGLERIRHSAQPEHNALGEIDYASTISGGGMAMGVYVASLHDYVAAHRSLEGYSFEKAFDPAGGPGTDPDLRRHLERSYTDVLLEGMFSLTRLKFITRGNFLERSFNNELLGGTFRGDDLMLGDLFARAGEGPGPDYYLPFWVPNACSYENGAIFPFTPDILKLYQVTRYTHNLKHVTFSDDLPLDSPDYQRWIEAMPVSVGVTASGNFPGAVPATTLGSRMDPLNPWLHLFDGGLADNLGVMTALNLLRQEQRLDAEAEQPKVRRKVLLVIDAYQGTFAPFSKSRRSPTAVEITIRLMTISLDSWRGRHRAILRSVTESDDPDQQITCIFLNFEDLLGLYTYEPLFDDDFTEDDLRQLMQASDGQERGDDCAWSPYLMARSIATSFDVTPPEQRFLLAAGRYCARLHADEISEALGWKEKTD